MTNFFAKKNPFMSVWLSGVNQTAAYGRIVAGNAMPHQRAKTTDMMTKAAFDIWRSLLTGQPRRKRSKTAR